MRKMIARWIPVGAALAVMAAPLTATAQVPGEIPIQGYLTDAEGTPYDGEVAIGFTIYDAPTEGAELFTERLTTIVEGGVFSVYLGSTTELDLGIFRDHANLYLGLQVGADPEASPRLRFGTVPWAAVSDSTASFGGVAAADFPTTVEDWARGVCLDGEEELTALLDDNYANPAWDSITGIPADIADGDDGFTTEDELTTLLDDNYLSSDYVPPSASWDTLLGIPEGFADGVDDDTDTTYSAVAPLELTDTRFGLSSDGCAAGAVWHWDGAAWACTPDLDTTYTAGEGLALDDGELSLDDDYLTGAAYDERFIVASAEERPARSCLEILEAGNSQGSGFYWVDTDGDGPGDPYQVYCDMETHGGGWTMCYKHSYHVAPSFGNYPTDAQRQVHFRPGRLVDPESVENQDWAVGQCVGYEGQSHLLAVAYGPGRFLYAFEYHEGESLARTWRRDRYDEGLSSFPDLIRQGYEDGLVELGTSRAFYITHNHGGCGNDAGILVVTSDDSCNWDGNGGIERKIYVSTRGTWAQYDGGHGSWTMTHAHTFALFWR